MAAGGVHRHDARGAVHHFRTRALHALHHNARAQPQEGVLHCYIAVARPALADAVAQFLVQHDDGAMRGAEVRYHRGMKSTLLGRRRTEAHDVAELWPFGVARRRRLLRRALLRRGGVLEAALGLAVQAGLRHGGCGRAAALVSGVEGGAPFRRRREHDGAAGRRALLGRGRCLFGKDNDVAPIERLCLGRGGRARLRACGEGREAHGLRRPGDLRCVPLRVLSRKAVGAARGGRRGAGRVRRGAVRNVADEARRGDVHRLRERGELRPTRSRHTITHPPHGELRAALAGWAPRRCRRRRGRVGLAREHRHRGLAANDGARLRPHHLHVDGAGLAAAGTSLLRREHDAHRAEGLDRLGRGVARHGAVRGLHRDRRGVLLVHLRLRREQHTSVHVGHTRRADRGRDGDQAHVERKSGASRKEASARQLAI
mmetsp:Transcript_11927/g.33997  ORF Transcript_11927/g.33997 Transcript_11927/m.33997 type:complete len:429 (+) Transcript_11927:616-1902(+)